MQFRKKPVMIEAIQWSGNSNKKEIEDFVGRELKAELESETAYLAGKGAPLFSLLIETKEGVMKVMPNDWVIKEPFPTGDRDFYPCKPDIFANTYDVAAPTGGATPAPTSEIKKVKWKYCPECGETETVNINLVGEGYRECRNCGQEWWVDIDYTYTVRLILQGLAAKVKATPAE